MRPILRFTLLVGVPRIEPGRSGSIIRQDRILVWTALRLIWDAPARIEGSLIGKDVLVHRTATLPKVIRLMVGDHSEVDLA